MELDTLRRLKREKGITNSQLADMAGLTLSNLDKITSGINNNPKLETIRAIANALGCSIEILIAKPTTRTTPSASSNAMGIATAYDRAPDHIQRSIRAMLEPYMFEFAEELAPVSSLPRVLPEREQMTKYEKLSLMAQQLDYEEAGFRQSSSQDGNGA
jgi:transcriptional regulator with XRE-family HTH domain